MATKTPERIRLDGLELLRADHATVEMIFQRLEKLPNPSPTKTAMVRKLIKELSIHAAIEEQILYPLIRTEIEGGADLAGEALDDHHEVKEALNDLQRLKPGTDEYDTVLLGLIDEVREHVIEEEEKLFPRVRRVVDAERLADLAKALQQAKKVAPTRPHPEAPDEPPANVVAGMPIAALDRARDVGMGALNLGVGLATTAIEKSVAFAAGMLRRLTR